MKCTKCGYPKEPGNVVIGGRRKFKRLTVRGKMFTTGDIELLTVKVMRATQAGVPVFKPCVEPKSSLAMEFTAIILICSLVVFAIVSVS